MTPLQQRFLDAIEKHQDTTDGNIYAAYDCEKITEEFAMEFATWIDDNGCTKFNGGWTSIIDTEKLYTINELIQQFKEPWK